METARRLGLYTKAEAASLLQLENGEVVRACERTGYTKRYLTVPSVERIWVEAMPFALVCDAGERREEEVGRWFQAFVLEHGGILTPNLAQLRFRTRAEGEAWLDELNPDEGKGLRIEELGPAWHAAVLRDIYGEGSEPE